MLIAGDPPALTAEESAQSARVAGHIHGLIAANGGWLPFSRFMDAALYAPGLGYYMTERPIFGATGDFVTAPELSPLFAACVATQIAELLERMGGGDIVEFGAGSGLLSTMLFETLLARGQAPDRYCIVEPSPALRERQRAVLAQSSAATRVEWLESPPRESWQGVAFANEVVDALPVERFRIGADGTGAFGVMARADAFVWQLRTADPALATAVASIQACLPARMPENFVSELRPGLPAWLGAATAALTRGAFLLIDYGLPRAQYYHPARDGGTLCGFRRHRRVADVLASPGLQDLTAWVDFSALADAARGSGMDIGGFATQAHFLVALGVDRELAAQTDGASERASLAIRQSLATLLLPGEMGERFKALLLTRGIDGPHAGFAFRDLAESL